MNTRKHSYNILSTHKNITKCSYCNEHGHKINYCKNNSIEQLESFGRNTIVLGYLLIGSNYNSRTHYTRIWGHTLTKKELQVIGYKYGHGNNSFQYVDEYINKFINIFDEQMMQKNDKFKQIIMCMDQNIITKFLNDIKGLCSESDYEYIKRDLSIYRSHIKYPIKVNKLNVIEKNKIENDECPICLENLINDKNKITSDCNHIICTDCYIQMMYSLPTNNDNSIVKCPLCRNHIDEITLDETNTNIYMIETFCSTEMYYKQKELIESGKNMQIQDINIQREHIISQDIISQDTGDVQDRYTKLIDICYTIMNICKIFILILCFILLVVK